jgi:hypothetical protein
VQFKPAPKQLVEEVILNSVFSRELSDKPGRVFLTLEFTKLQKVPDINRQVHVAIRPIEVVAMTNYGGFAKLRKYVYPDKQLERPHILDIEISKPWDDIQLHSIRDRDTGEVIRFG